jgi:hypothetical protein
MNKLKEEFEIVTREYDALQDWQKKLIVMAELRKQQVIRQKFERNHLRDTNNDWT